MTTQQILQGVHDWTNGKTVYDISVANPDGQGKPTPYADLAAALGNGGANIPEGLRKGGMSVKFIKGSDNKYVQFRYMLEYANTTDGNAAFINPDNWQGVDDKISDGSKNLSESGAVAKAIEGFNNSLQKDKLYISDKDGFVIGYFDTNGLHVTNVSVLNNNELVSVLTLLGNKVDKDGTKVLSQNDFTDALKAKLDGIEEGATKNTDGIIEYYNGALYITDNDGFVFMKIANDGDGYKLSYVGQLTQQNLDDLRNNIIEYERSLRKTVVKNWEDVLFEATATTQNYRFTDKIPVTGGANLMFNYFDLVHNGEYTKANLHIVGYRDDGTTAEQRTSITDRLSSPIKLNDRTVFVECYLEFDGMTVGNTYGFKRCFIEIEGYDSKAFPTWEGRNLLVYGDSVTASCNGDFTYPYDSNYASTNKNSCWANRVANHYKMAHQYGRGIGGQAWKWSGGDFHGGGAVSFVNKQGVLIDRLNEYDYDQWNALETKVYPAGVTAEAIASGDVIVCRGSGCSWLRITSQIPEAIRKDVDLILMMFYNGTSTANAENLEPNFIANDVTDPEWAASDYYSLYNGDYDLSKNTGAMLSTVMKMQVWCPNAVIVLMTQISSVGAAAGAVSGNITYYKSAEDVRNVSKYVGVPLIDLQRTCRINTLNRINFVSDTIHPVKQRGRAEIARAVIGGLKSIIPFVRPYDDNGNELIDNI